MPGIETFILGTEKLTQIFGGWPSFHDAEVVELGLWRGNADPDKGQYVFPVITAKIHLWEMTKEVDAKGHFVLKNHTLVTIRFEGADEVELNGFNDQNALFGLAIERQEPAQDSSTFKVCFEPAFGLNGTFKCIRIEIVDAVACSDDGKVVDSAGR